MKRACSIFSQILKLRPRPEFEAAAKVNEAYWHAAGAGRRPDTEGNQRGGEAKRVRDMGLD